MTTWCEIRAVPSGPTPESADFTLQVTFRYDASAIEALKRLIPASHRTWDADRQAWFVHPRHLDALKTWALLFAEPMLIEGARWENLHSGLVYEQLSIFGDPDV